MDWHELVNDALPPPRGDEPGGLRQDIADELADHFDCALRREQLRLADEDAAHDAALKKFGDPKLLAYRLWFDAMKGAIMKRRLFKAAAYVSTVMCVVMVAAWYVSFFRGGYVSVTTGDLVTYRVGVQEIGNVLLSRAVNIRDVEPGTRSGLGRPHVHTNTPPGVPWFKWDHDVLGEFQHQALHVPFWFLALCAAMVPVMYAVVRSPRASARG
jgi:hypothetical protein